MSGTTSQHMRPLSLGVVPSPPPLALRCWGQGTEVTSTGDPGGAPLGKSTKMHCTDQFFRFTFLSLPQARSIMKYLSNLGQIKSLQSKSSANRLSVKLLLLPCACHEITHPFNLSSISHNRTVRCAVPLCVFWCGRCCFWSLWNLIAKQLNTLSLIKISHFHILINRKIQHLESRAKTSASGTQSRIDQDWDMTLFTLARPWLGHDSVQTGLLQNEFHLPLDQKSWGNMPFTDVSFLTQQLVVARGVGIICNINLQNGSIRPGPFQIPTVGSQSTSAPQPLVGAQKEVSNKEFAWWKEADKLGCNVPQLKKPLPGLRPQKHICRRTWSRKTSATTSVWRHKLYPYTACCKCACKMKFHCNHRRVPGHHFRSKSNCTWPENKAIELSRLFPQKTVL